MGFLHEYGESDGRPKKEEHQYVCESYKKLTFDAPENYDQFLFGLCQQQTPALLSAIDELSSTETCLYCQGEGTIVGHITVEKMLYTKFSRLSVSGECYYIDN